MKKIIGSLFVLLIVAVIFSCSDSRSRSASKYDSLFLGISLGMGRQAFFDHCWDYNQKKILIHGPTNQNVEYRIVEDINSPVSMRFYPTFYEDKIIEMPVTFSYEAWAPWNRQFFADSLFVNMLPLFKKWYGDDFKRIDHPEMGVVYYKMDGKRRINLYVKNERYVQAVFTDLKAEKEITEAAKKKADGINE